MNRTIEKVRDELRKHTEKWKEANEKGDYYGMGYATAMIGVLDEELFQLEKAAREFDEQSQAEYKAFIDERVAWDFADSLEANQFECPSKR